jgi:uncharacterized protein YdeI (YjbR/CyaY-like superfamily)
MTAASLTQRPGQGTGLSNGRPRFFATPAAFRGWLERHHERSTELLVGFWKFGTGRPSLTWPESVDQALCFGWIDGVRRALDADRYIIRFTPRKARSRWSLVNQRRAEALIEAGRMAPAGLRAWKARPDRADAGYSFETRAGRRLPRALDLSFRARPDAWQWFQARPPGYRRTALHWVLSAKREETRARRLATLVECSAAGRPIPPLARTSSSRR